MKLLGYEHWENFEKTICRAMESCETSGIEITNHFREVTKLVEIGSGARRSVRDYTLFCHISSLFLKLFWLVPLWLILSMMMYQNSTSFFRRIK